MPEKLDRFSQVAEGYARYRPHYPDSLYRFIFSLVGRKQRAWDVGTGNGQVAIALSKEFVEVIATDISASQLAHASPAANIIYRVSPAEDSGIDAKSINLITVAQAAHWFQIDAFTKEVMRIGAENTLLAIWGYLLFKSEPHIDALVNQLYADILNGFWDPQRELVNRRYKDFSFPFEEIPCPEFEMLNNYGADDVLGYFRTWSAVNKYRQLHKEDPVSIIEDQLIAAYGERKIQCRTPVFMRAWRI